MLGTAILRILRSKIYYISQFPYLMVLLFKGFFTVGYTKTPQKFLAFEVKPYYWEVPCVTNGELHFTIKPRRPTVCHVSAFNKSLKLYYLDLKE